MIYQVFPQPRTTFWFVAAEPLVYTQLRGWRDCLLWMFVWLLGSKLMEISALPFVVWLFFVATTCDVSFRAVVNHRAVVPTGPPTGSPD